MTIPNVTMRWCQNQATCKWCEGLIEPSQAMVVVFFWNKGADGRRWNVQYCYHPDCWLKQGYDYLERNPYFPHDRGRRREFTEEQRRQRYLVTRRFHSLVQRRKNLSNGSATLTVCKLECQMADLMLEMRRLGGVPKGWIDKL